MDFAFLKDKILLLTPKWGSTDATVVEEQVCSVEPAESGLICTLLIPVYTGDTKLSKTSIGIKFPVRTEKELGTAFGLIKIGPGTWKVDGLVRHEPIKAYVILCGVPEPAPWEEETCHTDCTLGNSYPQRTGEKAESSKVA